MKHPKSPIWQKKKKRKFKNTKKTQSVEKNVVQKENVIKKEKGKKESFLKRLFHKPKEKPKNEERKQSVFKKTIKEWFIRHDSDIQLVLFPLILLAILIIINVFNNQLFSKLDKEQTVASSQMTALNPYPYVEAVSQPNISAKAAIILDRDSQVILYSKNEQLRFSMASTTKIMTSLVALSYYKPDQILTVKRSYVEGSGLNFYEGEQFTFMNLMYAMLLPSANDAAQAIADNYPGGSDAFVKQMNQRAQGLHLTNTHYADPIGLDDDGDYSTVVDMARLASYAITNPTFAQITSTKYRTIYDLNYSKPYQLTNTNELLGIDGVIGIKTGTTEGAGEVLVTSVVKNNHTYIIVVMDSLDRFGDTDKLLNFIDTDVKYVIPPEPPGVF
jgi:D-alanyl-D-alanine carboxypeptidase-like protein